MAIILAQSHDEMQDVPRRQLAMLEWIGIALHGSDDRVAELISNLVLDALIGYSLHGGPTGPMASLIRTANASGRPVLALDLPSGLDGDTGEPSDPTIRATATLTLALPKRGLRTPAARPWVGELYLTDISVPAQVYHRLGLTVGPIFARDDVIPIDLP